MHSTLAILEVQRKEKHNPDKQDTCDIDQTNKIYNTHICIYLAYKLNNRGTPACIENWDSGLKSLFTCTTRPGGPYCIVLWVQL